MPIKYENPTLYNSVNQPVDRKTGLVVQQEIPIRQLGRMTQKYDQGFLDFVADRVVAKYFKKKGRRGTAIFLPDRIRFTRKGFRETLFYREIKVFYKSDPQTYCFVLYVIDEKTAKRKYEVYQCDNIEDVRRIEDIMDVCRQSANRLLLDPDPIDENVRRRSLPSAPYPQGRSTLPKGPNATSHNIFECPHCKRISVAEPDALSETYSDRIVMSSKYAAAPPRDRNGISGRDPDDDWVRVEDRWRDEDRSGSLLLHRRAKSHNPSRHWNTWDDSASDYEIIERRYRRKPPPSYIDRTYRQSKPGHVASTYGPVTAPNRDRQHALHQGKPHLNRQTMQIVPPYMETAPTNTRRIRSESDMNAPVVYYGKENVDIVRDLTPRRIPSPRPQMNGTARKDPEIEPEFRNPRMTYKAPPINENGYGGPLPEPTVNSKGMMIPVQNGYQPFTCTTGLERSDSVRRKMYFERFPSKVRTSGRRTVSESPIVVKKIAQTQSCTPEMTNGHTTEDKPSSRTTIEYVQNPTEVPRLYTGS